MYFENLLLCAFVELFPNYPLQINVNKNLQKHLQCFISWLVNSSFYSWQSYSLTTWPQKFSTSAYIFIELYSEQIIVNVMSLKDKENKKRIFK
jgi:hypothetical protein